MSGLRWDAIDRRDELIKAATLLFAQKGYVRATVRELAKQAGCSQGLIRHHFGDKQGLLMAVLGQRRSDAQSAVHRLPPCDTVEEEFIQFFEWNIDSIWKTRDVVRVSRSRAGVDPEIAMELRHHAGERHATIAERLAVHQARGQIAEDQDLVAVAKLVCTAASDIAITMQLLFGEDRDVLSQVARQFAEIISAGIRPRRDVSPSPAKLRPERARRHPQELVAPLPSGAEVGD